MASLDQLIEEIDRLKAEYDALKPLKPEDEERLWRKLRLEWNYNSNHMEGNTLTYGETELLIFFGKTSNNPRDIRDYEEMSAHDTAVKMVKGMAEEGERDLTEAFIRELNEIILVKPYYKDASTADGQPSRKQIIPGQYKTTPNSVRTASGEIFSYPSPEETPAMMTDLIDWYRKATEEQVHPLEIAALLHYRFVRIHPFDDGNGRTARLLMNYVLLKFGFPPVVIKSDDKINYIGALNQADVGNLEVFIEYIGSTLLWSLELGISAAKGKDIEEQEDWKKQLKVFKKKKQSGKQIKRNDKIISALYSSSLHKFFIDLFNNIVEFNDLFIDASNNIEINGTRIRSPYLVNPLDFLNTAFNKGVSIPQRGGQRELNLSPSEIHWIILTFNWSGLNGKSEDYKLEIAIELFFRDYNYSLGVKNLNALEISKSYDQEFFEKEGYNFINSIGKHLVMQISVEEN